MKIEKNIIEELNQPLLKEHQRRFDFVAEEIDNVDVYYSKIN